MGTARHRRHRFATEGFSRAIAVHLAESDCYLGGSVDQACTCGLRDAGGQLVAELAAFHWQRNRDAILAGWGFPFATFAACLFDQAPLPDPDAPGLTPEQRRMAEVIVAAVAQARSADVE